MWKGKEFWEKKINNKRFEKVFFFAPICVKKMKCNQYKHWKQFCRPSYRCVDCFFIMFGRWSSDSPRPDFFKNYDAGFSLSPDSFFSIFSKNILVPSTTWRNLSQYNFVQPKYLVTTTIPLVTFFLCSSLRMHCPAPVSPSSFFHSTIPHSGVRILNA